MVSRLDQNGSSPEVAMTNYVGYARVSTKAQGQSGLGLDAQEAAIRRHLRPDDKLLTPVMVEVESGRKLDRPVLQVALNRCRLIGATLLVAKMGRLARNRAFIGTILASGVLVEFCDLPAIKGATGTFLLGIMAEVAQLEAGLISERTKAALAASTKTLGGYRGGPVPDARLSVASRQRAANAFAGRVAPLAGDLRAQGMSFNAIATELTAQSVLTARGGVWTGTAVRRVLARAAA
jgi:DNA invertase Pin-like site-specific DNA recombinase